MGKAWCEVRLTGPADAEAIASAFAAEGSPLPLEELGRYLVEQDAGSRLLAVAEVEGRVAGYLTVSWIADHPAFHEAGIPEIQDLHVLASQRRRGVASRLLEFAETRARERGARAIGLGVGLYAAYGPAQRLYGMHGFVPDGAGATSGGRALHGGETIPVDDSLVLRLTKRLI